MGFGLLAVLVTAAVVFFWQRIASQPPSAVQFFALVSRGDTEAVQAALQVAPELAGIRQQQSGGETEGLEAEMRKLQSVFKWTPSTGQKLYDNGYCPLDVAVLRNDPAMIHTLIQGGANPTNGNEYGVTPMHYAAKWGRGAAMEQLLAEGVSPEVRATNGLAPLHWASVNGHFPLTIRLLALGCDVNAQTLPEHAAPIHGAAARGNAEMVQLLLEHGAQVNVRGKDGLTPLNSAVKHGWSRVVDLLLERGADLHIADDAGKTPLDYAQSGKNTNILMRLQQSAATVR